MRCQRAVTTRRWHTCLAVCTGRQGNSSRIWHTAYPSAHPRVQEVEQPHDANSTSQLDVVLLAGRLHVVSNGLCLSHKQPALAYDY